MLSLNSQTGWLNRGRISAALRGSCGWLRRAGCALALAVLLPALLVLSGCASGYSGLPGNIGLPTSAGFQVVSTSLADGVAGRTYAFYVLLHGGTAPFNCATGITGMPMNLSATSTTVPSGPQAGTAACLIMGTVAANAAAGSPYALSFNLRDSSSPALVTSAALNLNIRPEFTVMAPPVATNDGVVGLSYGVAPKSSTATTTVSATVGNAPLTACAFAAGTNLMGNPLGVTASGANCALASTANLTTASTLSLTITATDTAIVDPITGLQVVPPNTISGPAAALKIDAALAFVAGLPAAPMVPWDVNTPSAIPVYLKMTPSLTVTTTGGLPLAQTTYMCTDSGATTFASLGLAVATVAPNCTLSGTPTATATNAAVAISVTNNGNAAVPANPALVTSSTLTINAQAVVTTPAGNFVAGVSNTDGAAAPNRPYSVSVSAGTAAAPGTGTLTLSAAGLNAGNCAGLSLTTAMSTQPVSNPVMGNPSAVAAAPIVCSFMVSVTDGIATNTSNFTITINPPLRVTGPANLPDAVTDRTYTLPAAVVTISGGLPPYTSCVSAGQPAQMSTTLSGAASCVLKSNSNPIAVGGPSALTFTAMDTGDTATAGASGTNAAAISVTVDAMLTINMALAAPMAPYDVNAPAAIAPYPTATVTTMGGLPAAQTTYSCAYTGFATVGLTGNAISSMAPPTCTVTGTPTTAGSGVAVSVTINDIGNSAVPAGMAASNSMITINNQAVVTTTQASITAAGPGVTDVDAGGAAPARVYTFPGGVSAGTAAAPGTGNLTLTSTGLGAASCAGFTAINATSAEPVSSALTGTPSATVTAPATATCMFSLTVTDGIATNTTNFTITINPPLRVTGPANLPDAVTDRTYTLPAAVVTISGGLPPYTSCVSAGQPAQMSTTLSGAASCVQKSNMTPIAVGGPSALTFTAMDTGDTATAGASGTNAAAIAVTVDAMLTINVGLPGAPAGPMAPWTVNAAQPYLNATPSLTVTSMGGLPAAQTTYSCADAGPVTFASFGLTVGPISSMTPPTCPLSGTPTATESAASVSIKIADTGNTAVPLGFATSTSTITINAQAKLTTTITSPADDGVSSTDSGGFVANRPYSLGVSAGTAGAPGTGNLTLTSNIGGVASCASLSLTPNAPAPVTVTGTISGNPSISTTAPTPTMCMFMVTVTDATNTANSTMYTIVIQPPLRLSFTPAAGFGNGAVGQPFTQTLTATGGITAVQNCTTSGFPASLTAMFAAGTPSCTIKGTPVGGDTAGSPYTGMVTVMDGTDAATAAAGSASNSSVFSINPALSIVVPATIVNGMSGFVYPGALTPVASVTYSVSGGTGGATTFFANSTATSPTCTAGAPANFPGGTLGFTPLTATTFELMGTPMLASPVSTGFSFPICAVDAGSTSTAAYAVQTGSNVNLAVFEPTTYAAGQATSTLELIDTSTNPPTLPAPGSITLSGGLATPSGLAVLTSGLAIFTADIGTNSILSNFTVGGGAGPIVALPAACGAPVELATTPDPVKPGHDRLYATCPGANSVAVYDVTSAATFSAGIIKTLSTGAGSAPTSVAIQSDNSHVFVTLNTPNSLYVVDNTQPVATLAPVLSSPFALDPTTTAPTGVAVTANGAKVYAYIGKAGYGAPSTVAGAPAGAVENAGQTAATITTTAAHHLVVGESVVIAGVTDPTFDGTFTVVAPVTATSFTVANAAPAAAATSGAGTVTPQNQGIEVEDVTSVGTSGLAGTTTLITDILLAAGATPDPDNVGVDPTNAFVYVTFPFTDQFAAVSNVAVPVQIGGSPFNLPSLGAATDIPGGVTVPPVPSGTVLVYFTGVNTSEFDVVNQGAAPTANTTVATKTPAANPGRIVHIPIPQ